jgi:drug/metabolite transporter (DMT)-like permease
MIPAVIFLKGEKVHWKGYAGAALTVAGTAMMFLG